LRPANRGQSHRKSGKNKDPHRAAKWAQILRRQTAAGAGKGDGAVQNELVRRTLSTRLSTGHLFSPSRRISNVLPCKKLGSNREARR
jgi:hypothetical protein